MSARAEVDNIDAEIKALQDRKQKILDAQRSDALQQVKNLIGAFGFTARDLGLAVSAKAPAAHAKAKVEPKYRNPNNPGETWRGGRGPKPKWVKAFLESGGALDSLSIGKAKKMTV